MRDHAVSDHPEKGAGMDEKDQQVAEELIFRRLRFSSAGWKCAGLRFWNAQGAADHQAPADCIKDRQRMDDPRTQSIRPEEDEVIDPTQPEGDP